MTIGTIAITGLGVPGIGVSGFAGFYSKDAILGAAFMPPAQQNSLGYFAYVVGVFVAGLTSYYSWRLVFMTFNGHARWGRPRSQRRRSPRFGRSRRITGMTEHWHDGHGHDDHGARA